MSLYIEAKLGLVSWRPRSLRCEKCNRSIGDTVQRPRKCPHCGGKLR